MRLTETLLNRLATFLIILSMSSCSTNKIKDDNNFYDDFDLDIVHQNDWVMSDDILYFINEHRIHEGKKPLIKDTLYATAYAVKHSQYMISKSDVNHDLFFLRSNGLKAKGAIRVSENVAYGYTSAQSVVNAWLNSESHKKVIESDYSNIGFGVLKSLDDKYYFTTLFYK